MSTYATINPDGTIQAFYREDVNGFYHLRIPQPGWEAPLIPDPDWTPGESETQADRPLIPDPLAQAPLVPSSEHDPDSGIPEEAFPITEEQYAQWLQNQDVLRWDGTGLEAFVNPETYSLETRIAEVNAESERRRNEGRAIPGVGQFKTRPEDIAILGQLLRSAELDEELSQPIDFKFKTEAGATVTIASLQQIRDLYLWASAHVKNIYARSAELQDLVQTMTAAEREAFDASDESHWTAPSP